MNAVDAEYERIDRYRREALADIQQKHERLIGDPSRIKMVIRRTANNVDVVLAVDEVLVGPAGTIVYVR